MSVFSLLLNIPWIVFGGLWMAIGWVIAAVTLADAAVLRPRTPWSSPKSLVNIGKEWHHDTVAFSSGRIAHPSSCDNFGFKR
jgi:uncharacterized membrane protein YccF (DUF307 family)